jgi:hypothetical protein
MRLGVGDDAARGNVDGRSLEQAVEADEHVNRSESVARRNSEATTLLDETLSESIRSLSCVVERDKRESMLLDSGGGCAAP